MSTIKLDVSWKEQLIEEFRTPYMSELKTFLKQEKEEGKKIYPLGSEYFRALDLTAFHAVRVVILGQDPYHGPGQAHGLSFSVKLGVKPPPSLLNIYKELEDDLNITPVSHGFLESWARQGVLLLNSVLTVESRKAASHQGKGWEQFTDAIVKKLATQRNHLVFILWGAYAQKKCAFIDRTTHCIIESPHPSPLAAYRGFFGSKPFSQANAYLLKNGQHAIDWRLPEQGI